MEPYKTLLESASDTYIVNKSRFIGHAAPVETEDAALAFLRSVRERHKDASHNCYAYIIGRNRGIMRYSDDGEPSGTAGLPMMEVLKARGVVDCCAVVTRYFGGVLLGAGGLVRAYSHTCALGLTAAKVVTRHPTARLLCEVPYPLYDRVSHMLQSQPVIVEDAAFLTGVTLTLLVRERDLPALLSRVEQTTNARAAVVTAETLFYPWGEDE